MSWHYPTNITYLTNTMRAYCSRHVLKHYFWKNKGRQDNTLKARVWKWYKITNHSPKWHHTSLILEGGSFLTNHTDLHKLDSLRQIVWQSWTNFARIFTYWFQMCIIQKWWASSQLIPSSWDPSQILLNKDVIMSKHEARQMATANMDQILSNMFTFQ